jgi:hypothetical protein
MLDTLIAGAIRMSASAISDSATRQLWVQIAERFDIRSKISALGTASFQQNRMDNRHPTETTSDPAELTEIGL